MNYIKHDQYDRMYFNYLEQKYDLTNLVQGNKMKILDRDMLFDLYNILFKEHLEVLAPNKRQVSRNDYIRFLLINKIMESNYLKKLKSILSLTSKIVIYLFLSFSILFPPLACGRMKIPVRPRNFWTQWTNWPKKLMIIPPLS